MRPSIPAFVILALLLAAPAAHAAPTCLDKNADTIRCATPNAMPVGWTPSPQRLLDRQKSIPPGPSLDELLKVAFGIALFFALIALLPEFDGARDADWDKQEGNDAERG